MMGLIVSEVYDALIEAGASPDKARAAASAVPPADNVATKEDIARIESNMATKQDLADLRHEMLGFKAEARQDMADFKAVVSQDMASFKAVVHQDMADFKAEVRQDMADFKARLNQSMADFRTAVGQDIAKLGKKTAVLNFAVLTLGPAIVALLIKLTFFP